MRGACACVKGENERMRGGYVLNKWDKLLESCDGSVRSKLSSVRWREWHSWAKFSSLFSCGVGWRRRSAASGKELVGVAREGREGREVPGNVSEIRMATRLLAINMNSSIKLLLSFKTYLTQSKTTSTTIKITSPRLLVLSVKNIFLNVIRYGATEIGSPF